MGTKTAGPRSHLAIVNADPANAVTGTAVMSVIVAEAARRPHLKDSIHSIQFEKDRGIGVLVIDAGAREHLANVYGFAPDLIQYNLRGAGMGYARQGEMAGVQVTIWNVEA
jgi:hypothetical protein